MKRIIKINKLLPLLLLFAINVYGQITTTNVEDIFKMWMYLDKVYEPLAIKDSNVVKGDAMYRVYYDAFTFKIEQLAKTGDLSELMYPELHYQFYEVDISKIEEKRKLFNKEIHYLGNAVGMNYKYVIAINLETGKSYRITGFNQSDFLAFLSDFKARYESNYGYKLTARRFLKHYKVATLDFYCLNKGLKKINRDYCKYPCLKRCNDPISLSYQ